MSWATHWQKQRPPTQKMGSLNQISNQMKMGFQPFHFICSRSLLPSPYHKSGHTLQDSMHHNTHSLLNVGMDGSLPQNFMSQSSVRHFPMETYNGTQTSYVQSTCDTLDYPSHIHAPEYPQSANVTANVGSGSLGVNMFGAGIGGDKTNLQKSDRAVDKLGHDPHEENDDLEFFEMYAHISNPRIVALREVSSWSFNLFDSFFFIEHLLL